MRTLRKYLNDGFEPALLLATFLALLIYTSGLFIAVPYWGFEWGAPLFENVGWVAQPGPLIVGDELRRIGPVTMLELELNPALPLPDALWSAKVLPLTLVRDGQTLHIDYVVPGFTWAEFFRRLGSPWWLGWLFGIAGLLNYLSVRPKEVCWRLLTVFYCFTAILLVTSTMAGRMRLWEASLVGRTTLWLSIPVYWHLHWIFPERLSQRPIVAVLGKAAYLLAGFMVLLEWSGRIPTWGSLYGFLAAVLGLVLPQVIRLFLPSALKRARLLWLLLLASGLPAVTIVVFSLAGLGPNSATLGSLGLPLVPIVYFYVAYQRQLGGLELRANRLIALYLFTLVLAILAILILPNLLALGEADDISTVIAILGVIIAGVATALAFPAFQRFVERRLLGLRAPPRYLLNRFLAHITTSFNRAALVRALADDILPSLWIRQSALVLFSNEGQLSCLYARQVTEAELPTREAVTQLLAQAGRYRSPEADTPRACPWARLVLPLVITEKLLGLWLLGRRDPDDFYSQSEIDYLRTLAGQVALALTSLEQNEQLRALYQFNMDQREAERARLARDLHDVTLNQLAVLRNSVPAEALSPHFIAAYERVVSSLREAVSELHPPLLDYGLYFALKALASDHEAREEAVPELIFNLPTSPARYDSKVEIYTYRILKQAYDNALAHAGARQLRLSGCLEPASIDLTFEDDGRGFVVSEALEIGNHAARKHFGLRGMIERAALIGAKLHFDSAPGRGTRVRLLWHNPAPDPVPPPPVYMAHGHEVRPGEPTNRHE
jgi:signal transduction histidine kinase